MDIELLRTFLEVKHTRHFGKAADNLYITQAAVSARIKQLELLLGADLFTRYRNNLQLTATGERLVGHAETILIAWARAKQDVALRITQKPSLSCGTTDTLSQVYLQPRLTDLSAWLPKVCVRLEVYEIETLVRRVLSRTLDMALTCEWPKNSELEVLEVGALSWMLVSSEPEIALEQALTQAFIAVNSGDLHTSKGLELLSGADFQSNQMSLIMSWILGQGGSAYLPSPLVMPYLSKQLFAVEGAQVLHKPVYWIFPRDSEKRELIQQFCQIVLQ